MDSSLNFLKNVSIRSSFSRSIDIRIQINITMTISILRKPGISIALLVCIGIGGSIKLSLSLRLNTKTTTIVTITNATTISIRIRIMISTSFRLLQGTAFTICSPTFSKKFMTCRLTYGGKLRKKRVSTNVFCSKCPLKLMQFSARNHQ